MKPLTIAGKEFKSRLFLGTGKFASAEEMKQAVIASGTELVTIALRRVSSQEGNKDENLLEAIPSNVKVMLNTSGARNAEDAVKIAKIAKAAGYDWLKLEIHPDPNYLLPDPVETFKAAEELVKMGFTVLPYINADPVLAKRLEEIGVAAVMPLGSPIGSNQGIKTEAMLRIIIEQANIPVVVDAGLGLPSHAGQAIELGASAVLVNSAIAASGNPKAMAEAFAEAVKASEKALEARPAAVFQTASATSPMNLFNEVI